MGMWGKKGKIKRYMYEEPDSDIDRKKDEREFAKAFGARKVNLTRDQLLAKRGIKPPPPLGSKKKD